MSITDQNQAAGQLKHSAIFPYDCDGYEKTATPAKDWAHAAARGILADLSDRRGIKWELEKVDMDVRKEISASLADIIREAHRQYADLLLNAEFMKAMDK